MPILIYFHSGGHSAQMIKLVDLLGDKYDYNFVIPTFNTIAEKKIKVEGKIHKITGSSYLGNTKVQNTVTTIICIIQTLKILMMTRPKAVITCGPSTGLLISILAKFFGSKIIFIESWSRVTSFSHSGKYMYKIADLFFVQWEELNEKYPDTIHEGRFG